MDLQTALHFAWIVWIALVLIFAVIEVFTLDMTFLMLALGSVGGLLASLFGAPVWLQFVIAVVLALLLIFLLRPRLLRALQRGGDPTPSNVEALLGLSGTVTHAFVDGAGTAKLANGETWTARLTPPASGSIHDYRPLAIGDRVTVVAIEGATAVVEPVVDLPGISPERTLP